MTKRRRWTVRLIWEPRDLWVGVYWTNDRIMGDQGQHLENKRRIYICLLPCLPIVFTRREAVQGAL